MTVAEIKRDVGPLLRDLADLGFRVVNSVYSPEQFGNWIVHLEGPRTFAMVKDRGQFLVDADQSSLETAGLWRAHEDAAAYSRLVLAWAIGPCPADEVTET